MLVSFLSQWTSLCLDLYSSILSPTMPLFSPLTLSPTMLQMNLVFLQDGLAHSHSSLLSRTQPYCLQTKSPMEWLTKLLEQDMQAMLVALLLLQVEVLVVGQTDGYLYGLVEVLVCFSSLPFPVSDPNQLS